VGSVSGGMYFSLGDRVLEDGGEDKKTVEVWGLDSVHYKHTDYKISVIVCSLNLSQYCMWLTLSQSR